MNQNPSPSNTFSIWASFIALLVLPTAFGLPVGLDTVIMPFSQRQVFDLADSEELFANSPAYDVHQPRQVLYHNQWQGASDFNAKFRGCWGDGGIYFRFDVVDDTPIKVSTNDYAHPDGDFIRLDFANLTCGPDRLGRQSWSVLLLPDLAADSCEAVLLVDSADIKRKIGKVKSALVRTIDGYAVVLQMPYNLWEDLPRSGGTTRFQAQFGDSDRQGQIDHRFVLAPVDRSVPNFDTNIALSGVIRYAEAAWVISYPERIINFNHAAKIMADAGNQSDSDLEIRIYLENVDTGEIATVDGTPREEVLKIPAHSLQQRLQIEFGLEGVPSATYRATAKAGVFYDSGAFVIKYNSDNGIVYCPNLIDRRARITPRELAATSNPDLVRETLRNLAGGGTVLWNAGAYNASSDEFPQYLRPSGKYEVDVAAAKPADIPWAMFGGLDAMDGMSEPLVLKIPASFGEKESLFRGPEPLVQSKRNPTRVARERFKYLVLLGLIMDQRGSDVAPDLQIATNSRVLVKQLLQPSSAAGSDRHAYAFRLWLSGADTELTIENTAAFGPRIEIDFIAVIGGGDDVAFPADAPAIRFTGGDQVETFNKMLPVSLYMMRNYLVDADGNSYSSLPGGRYTSLNVHDWGLLISELATWGCLDEATALARHLPVYFGASQNQLAAGRLDIGYATVITGVYNLWRKLGKPKDLLDPIWLSTIHRPTTAFVKEIDTNPLGLVNCQGELGVADEKNPGSTVPVFFAVQSAIGAAAEMARESGYGENAVGWKLAGERLYNNFKRNLVSPEGQIQIVSQDTFAGGWGVGEQVGIVALLPTNAWLYGRHEDGNPVLYNGNVRLFDTPYLLAGVSFWSDFYGFRMPSYLDAQLQASYDYALSLSPVFRKPAWSKHYIVDYNTSVHQLWTIMAGFYLDSIPIATNSLNSYIRYAFDEYYSPAPNADIEVSPWTFEEKLNVAEDGENLGATGDDLNALNGVTGLRVARLIAGVDDYDHQDLKLIPRLPDEWNTIEVSNWLVANAESPGGLATLSYRYERLAEGKYQLVCDSSQKLSSITVRVGPFPPKVRKVRIIAGDQRGDVNTFRHGFYAWAEQTFKKVKRLDMSVQSIIY